jgi:OOP family OmpA-OmpF porin
MFMTRARLGLIVALTCLLACAACSNVEPRLVQPTLVYYDTPVETSPLSVYIRPAGPAERPLSALYLPFLVREDMEHPRTIGLEVTRTFWQTWLSQAVFPTQVFDESTLFYGREDALNMARRAGADLLVSGEVSHYFNGGTRSDTSVSLRADIYDVASGQLLWSLAQAGRMEHQLDADFILAKRTTRMPESPMQAVIQRISAEMGVLVSDWSKAGESLPPPVRPVGPSPAAAPQAAAAPAAPDQTAEAQTVAGASLVPPAATAREADLPPLSPPAKY